MNAPGHNNKESNNDNDVIQFLSIILLFIYHYYHRPRNCPWTIVEIPARLTCHLGAAVTAFFLGLENDRLWWTDAHHHHDDNGE
jgi:hypothetical protein